MNLVMWNFKNLTVPMVEIEGELYTNTNSLCGAFEVPRSYLNDIWRRNIEEFDAKQPLRDVLNVPKEFSELKSFLQDHKEAFGIQRLKEGMRLWSESDVITFWCFLKSTIAREMRREFIRFVKTNAKKDSVSQQQFDTLVRQMQDVALRMDTLESENYRLQTIVDRQDAARVPVDQMASAAGRLLRMQKETKPFRTNKNIPV